MLRTFAVVLAACGLLQPVLAQQIPHLRKQGATTQLIVDGQPYLVLGGELLNSSSSSLEYMQPIWPRLKAMNLNTVLAAVTWELIEPEEGRFEFQGVDGLINSARENNLRLVFLWFGSWKNGMSSYIPIWVKKDFQRFERAKLKDGKTVEVLSTLSTANRDADAKAFRALMRHIKEVDGTRGTVIMVQVENEVGVLGDSRDRSPSANRQFDQTIPRQLSDFLAKNKDALYPDLEKRWAANGRRTSGSWEQVFGSGPETDEIFMAWNYASYVDRVTEAGKAEYPLPMFVNAWLSHPDRKPGEWPSGGPLPHVLDIWRAAAPHLDILTPDIYQPNFAEWCRRYRHAGNPLFIPEMMPSKAGAHNVFHAIGQHEAIGTSPFAIDYEGLADSKEIGASYGVLAQLAPVILANHGKGAMTGFVLDKQNPSVKAEMGGYELDIRLDSIFGTTAENAHGLIVATGPDEFVGAGSGFSVAFVPKAPGPRLAGLGPVDEGTYQSGKWVPGRRLNGDETDQGQHWRFSSRSLGIQRCKVYRYE